jgi:hypothetical protein
MLLSTMPPLGVAAREEVQGPDAEVEAVEHRVHR